MIKIPAFVDGLAAVALTIFLIWSLATIGIGLAHGEEQQRSFFDRDGDFAGSTSTYNGGRNTSGYDRDGHFAGSATRNSDGTTSFYDRSGHFTGSSRSTTQPK
jgi:hypothetical protein